MDPVAAGTLAAADYIVLGLVILVSVAIGAVFAYRDKHKNTTENYFLGDRKLKALPVGLSFVVTFQSSILILGFPAEAYAYGMQYAMQSIGLIAAYLLASEIVVPIFHPLKVTTVYQYYQLRYNSNHVRFVALVLGAIHYTFYMGIVIYGCALALKAAAGLPVWLSVVLISIVAIIYTSIGGFKTVIWTDVFQTLVMVIGILAVLIKTTIGAGGSGMAMSLSKNRLNFFDFNPDPTARHTFWTLVVGSFTQFLYLTMSQASIQRINSTPSQSVAKKLFYFAAPIYSAIWVLVMIQGLTIFAYYTRKGCDPLASGQITNVNQLIPFTMVHLFSDAPGLTGLFLAALAAACLSSISSGLNCLSAMTYEDIIKPHKPDIKDSTGTLISKVIVLIYGLIAVGFSFILSNVEGPLGQIMSSMMGAISGPEVGLYLCSIFFKKATTKGMVTGTLTGALLVFWLSLGQNFLAAVPKTPYLPAGPTHNCYTSINNATNSNNTSYLDNTSFLGNGSASFSPVTPYTYLTNTTTEIPASPPSSSSGGPQGILAMCSVSYMYFNLIGVITVVVVGTLVSLATQPKEPQRVSKSVMLPLSALIPPCFRRFFIKEEDKQASINEEEALGMLPRA